MDLYCPVKGCGEPWDNDEFHEVAEETGSTYAKVIKDFQRIGCQVIPGQSHNVVSPDEEIRDRQYGLTASEASSALFDLLGDDTDGIACMMEDMGF